MDINSTSRNNFSISYLLSSFYKKIEVKLFILLSFICIILSLASKSFENNISMFFTEISIPVVKITSFPLNYINDTVEEFQILLKSKEENDSLKQENTKLRNAYLQSLKINEENKYLKDLLKYVNVRAVKYKSSRIIGRSNKVYNDSVFLEIGLKHNIKQDAVVVGKYAMIGRISEVGKRKSRVLLPTDINSSIPIITSRNRNRGILKGNGDEVMEILYLGKEHGLKEKDMIFTSGDGDSLPYGILVAQISKIEDGRVYATMIEDINRTDIVTVIEY